MTIFCELWGINIPTIAYTDSYPITLGKVIDCVMQKI
jgi:hypothetical protein